jgi:hypothetical protein
LRVTLSAAHAEGDVEALLDALQASLARHPQQPDAQSVSGMR